MGDLSSGFKIGFGIVCGLIGAVLFFFVGLPIILELIAKVVGK